MPIELFRKKLITKFQMIQKKKMYVSGSVEGREKNKRERSAQKDIKW